MSSATLDLCGYERAILAEIVQRREVVGQFFLLHHILGLPGRRWGQVCLRRLHERGLIRIQRNGNGRRIIIRSVVLQ